MARQPVTELWIQQQGPGAVIQVRQADALPARSEGHALIRFGVAILVAGVVLSASGLFAMGTAIALGGAGALWLGRRQQKAVLALPPGQENASTNPAVLAERCRRVLVNLDEQGPCTFEALLARMRWTEPALLETLIQLKKEGRIEEDLDLDAGQWIYRPLVRLGGGHLTLDERRSRMHLENE